jgi:hypothetical protein
MILYPVLLRNDLPDNFLQVTDAQPDAPIDQGVNVRGSYLTWFPQNDAPVTTDSGGGVWVTSAAYNGLAAYILDNVEDVLGPNLAPLDAEAVAIALAILTRASTGLDIALADINTAIVASLGAGSDLNGAAVGSSSTGSLEDVLRIVSGDVYQVPTATAISGAARAFLAAPAGAFLARTAAGFRDRKDITLTGAWNVSSLTGQVSKLVDATYTWLNPANTYGAAGDALTILGANIPATGISRALALYDNLGAAL